jgi:hypothetical protein
MATLCWIRGWTRTVRVVAGMVSIYGKGEGRSEKGVRRET